MYLGAFDERGNKVASDGELPDAEITGELLKVSPLKKSVPGDAEQLEHEAFTIMPHLKITEPSLEVDQRMEFTLYAPKDPRIARDRSLLLTVILADAINLGLIKCPTLGPGHSGSRPDLSVLYFPFRQMTPITRIRLISASCC